MIRRTALQKSCLVLCLGILTGPVQAKFNKANAIMDIPGKKPVLVEVNETNPTQLILKYSIPDAELITLSERHEGKPLTRLHLGNAPLIGDESKPVLPVIPAQFIVPAGKTIASINIRRSKKVILDGNHLIEFGKAKIPLIKNALVRQAQPDDSIYQKNEGYPSENGCLVSVQRKRGVKIAFVNINPVQYFPKTGRITFFHQIELKVNLTDENAPQNIVVRKESLNPARMGVENPGALDSYQLTIITDPEQRFQPFCNPVDQFSYVFITGQQIRDAKTDFTVNDLIEHRRNNGTTATIVTIEEILLNYKGIDKAEKVRNFIIDAYKNWETQYVVLGGDVSIIPYRNLYSEETFIPSDLYFQCLDGSYNDDADMYWGEPNDGPNGEDLDLMAEVSVGRISAESPEEMANSVYKILSYENSLSKEPYLSHACMAGEYLGRHFGSGEFSFATPYLEEIRLGSEASGYITKGFISSNFFSSDTVYDNPNFEWSADSIIKTINSASYSIINHLGHSNESCIMKFNNHDADLLTNAKPIFLYSQGCYPGHFPVDCIAERLTTSNRFGMFAAVLNTVYGYGSYNDSKENMDGPSQRFDRQFWDAFFNESLSRVGDINADSHEDNIWCINSELIRYCMYETILFGDPFTKLHKLSQGPSLIYAAQEISDINGGNNDNICNPGESIDLTLSIQNIGSEPSVNALCSLTATNQYITIQSSVSNLPVVNSGAIQSVSPAFQINISADCPAPFSTELNLLIKDTDSLFVINIPLQVHRSSAVNGAVTDATGNGIKDARVCYTGAMSGSTITDPYGFYQCNLIEGSYSLWVEAKNFLSSDTFRLSVPPASILNIRMIRPIMTVEPLSIVENLKNNDSSEITVTITNSGDALLNLKTGCSVKLNDTKSINALRIAGQKKKSNHRYLSEHNKFSAIVPSACHQENSFSNSTRVLYLTTILKDGTSDNFTDSLRCIPSIVSLDVINGEDSTPNLSFLMDYDCVIVSSNNSWADPELLGETLADYVDNGRLLILTAGTFALGGDYRIKGRIANHDYIPLIAGYGDFNSCISTDFKGHEITTNVNKLQSSGIVSTSSLTECGELLGLYDCDNAIAVALNINMPVVALNVFPQDGYWGGDLIQVISNCIQWGIDNNWLSVVSTGNLSIEPGSSEQITVKLNPIKLNGGLHEGEISLIHNDPTIKSPFIIPVSLNIDGFRSLVADTSSFSFNEVIYGNADTLFVTLTNSGNEITNVYNIASDNQYFYCLKSTPFSLNPAKSVSVPIVFNPSHIGHFTGNVTIQSDAEDNSNIILHLSGDAVSGPNAILEPTRIDFSFEPQSAPTDKIIVLSNTGATDLKYSIAINYGNKKTFQMNHSATTFLRKDKIYDDQNYKHPFVETTIIIGLKKGSENFAFSNTLTQLEVRSVTELAKGINPVTKMKSFSTRTLLKLSLSEGSRDAVLKAINILRKDPNVEYAEPDYIMNLIKIPNDELFSSLYAMNNSGQTGGKIDSDIDAVEAWDTCTGSEEMVIGIIDTGIDYLHPDLVDNMWKNPGEIPDDGIDNDENGFVDDVYGWDFAYDDNEPMDKHGHGTHCSGTIAAKGNNGIGVAGLLWNARIMAIKFLDDNGIGSVSDAIDAINYATIMNVPVTSNSWGGDAYSQSLEEVIAATGIFVSAAGNNHSNNDQEPYYPSSYELDNIISVGATDPNDELTPFSNFGSKSVDLFAPGFGILSTFPGGKYKLESGTSMAVPHVSGAIGLLWSNSPYLRSLEVKHAILKNVDKISALKQKCTSEGRLNVNNAIFEFTNWISIAPQQSGTVSPSAHQNFTVSANPEALLPGTWSADIVFSTNDPFHNQITANVFAQVAGCKSLHASEDTIYAGSVWKGRDTSINITVINNCNEVVSISDCSFDNEAFSTSLSFPIKVEPFRKFEIPVKFTPVSSGNIQAIAKIISDAEDNPSLSVNLGGTCVMPPEITVAPDFLNKTIIHESKDSSVILLNNSGDADFDFIADILIPQNPSMGDVANATIYIALGDGKTVLKLNPLTGEPVDTITLNHQTGINGLAFDGEFLYYTAFDTPIVVFDPHNKKIVKTIGNPDASYRGVAVSNDYLIVGSINYDLITVLDKSSGVVISSWPAEYYGDVTYSASRNTIFLKSKNDHVVEYDILEYNLLNGEVLNGISTSDDIQNIGYSNSADVLFAVIANKIISINPDDGTTLQTIASIDNPWLITSDDVDSRKKWIQLKPTEGVVASGDSLPIIVLFSSKNLLAQKYVADILISHVHNVISDIAVPCTLSVTGKKHLRINPSEITFDQTWKGRRDSTAVFLINDGNEATTVSSIHIKSPVFSTSFNGPITVNAFDSVVFYIYCTPFKIGTVKDVITITSDSEDHPIIKANVTATTVKPPKIKVQPSSISVTMLPGQEAYHSINLKNTGGADYPFNVTTIIDQTGNPDSRTCFILYDALLRIDPMNGTITDTILPFHDASCLAYDGKYIYLGADWFDYIRIVDPHKKQVVDSIVLEISGIHGIAITEDKLIAASDNKVHVFDKSSKDLLYSWELYYLPDFTYCCHRNSLFFYNFYKGKIEERSIVDGALINSFYSKEYSCGLAYSASTRMLIASTSLSFDYINPENGEILGSFEHSFEGDMEIAADEVLANAWLKTTTKNGVVIKEGNTLIEILFNSSKLLPGEYRANIIIEHTEKRAPGPFVISCKIKVKAQKQLTAIPGDLYFGDVSTGYQKSLSVDLINEGNVTTKVKKVISSSKEFSIKEKFPIEIPPFSQLKINAIYSPINTGIDAALLTLKSNVSDILIDVYGTGVAPAIISIDPLSITTNIQRGTKESKTITLTNTGVADYSFDISVIDNGADTTNPGTKNVSDAKVYFAENSSIYQVNPVNGQIVSDEFSIPNNRNITGLAYDWDNLYVSSNTKLSSYVYVLDPASGTLINSFLFSLKRIQGLGVGSKFLVGAFYGEAGEVVIFDKDSFEVLYSWKLPYQTFALAYSESRKTVFVINDSTSVVDVRAISDGALIREIEMYERFSECAFSENSGLLFLGNNNGVLKAVDPDNGQIVHQVYLGHTIHGLAADEGDGCPSWLSIDTTYGLIKNGQTFTTQINFNTEELIEDNYNGAIIITPKEQGPGPFTFPCSLIVEKQQSASK